MLCYVMLCYVLLRYFMIYIYIYYVVLCYVMLCYEPYAQTFYMCLESPVGCMTEKVGYFTCLLANGTILRNFAKYFWAEDMFKYFRRILKHFEAILKHL